MRFLFKLFFFVFFFGTCFRSQTIFNASSCISEQAAQKSYLERVVMTIERGIKAAKDCADGGSTCSIWLAGAAFQSNQSDIIKVGYKVAAKILTPKLKKLYLGGNDGWPAFAVGDIFLRFKEIIKQDQTQYNVTGPFDPAITEFNSNSTSKNFTLYDIFRIVLTFSSYNQIDSTSNHETMNSVARFLAEQAFPGKIVNGYNKKKGDTGESTIIRRCKSIPTMGLGEYGSPNYEVMNFAPYLSVVQLTNPNYSNYANVTQIALAGYKSALLQMGTFWFKGNLAMTTGRGYPSSSVWGAAEGTLLLWVYFGGNFPSNSKKNSLIFGANEKSMGILPALAYFSGLKIESFILQIGQCEKNRIAKAHFALNSQYSYISNEYTHYSESRKHGGKLWQGASWASRIVFTVNNESLQNFSPVVLVTQPINASVNRTTLAASQLSGSGTYGQNIWEENLQSKDAVLHTYSIPSWDDKPDPRIVRGAIIYVPIPTLFVKKLTWNWSQWRGCPDGEGIKYPLFLDNNRKMFFGYDTIFIAIFSSSPISLGTVFNSPLCVGGGWRNIYNIYGHESLPGVALPLNATIQFAIGVETASPKDFKGSTLTEKFNDFFVKYSSINVPVKIQNDTQHPVFQYRNYQGEVMTSQFANRYDFGYRYKDWIGEQWGTNQTLVDFSKWPFLSSQLVINGTEADYMIKISQSDASGFLDFGFDDDGEDAS